MIVEGLLTRCWHDSAAFVGSFCSSCWCHVGVAFEVFSSCLFSLVLLVSVLGVGCLDLVVVELRVRLLVHVFQLCSILLRS